MNPSNPSTPASGTVTDGSVVENALLGGTRNVPLTESAERIYEKLTAEDNKQAEPKKEEAKDEPTKPTEEPKKEAEATKEGVQPTEAPAETVPETTGFFADEGLNDNQVEPLPTQPEQNVLPENYSDLEQYVAKNIGQPITVRVKVGDTIQNVKAYSPTNLPEGFEFASEHDRLNAQLGFDALTRKAEQLQVQFQNEQMQKSAEQFNSQEDTDIQKDIAWLQRQKQAGRDGLDLFKTLDVSDPEFENDPAVKEMQEVLQYYNDENQARWQQSQRTGSLYKPLTYRDAFRLYRIDNPKVGSKQAKEDAERKEIIKPLAKADSGTGDSGKQPRPKLGRYATVDQIIQAYNL